MTSNNQYPSIHVIGIGGVPEINTGDCLGHMLSNAAQNQGTPLQENDILVVTQKVISKSEGRVVSLKSVTPSKYARQIAADSGKNPCLVELILRESRSIVRMDPARGVIITETNHGFICANAGIDSSNIGDDDKVSLLPKNPDRSAHKIRRQVRNSSAGPNLAVIISDTFGRAWREGHVNFAIGIAGMSAYIDYRNTPDFFGHTLSSTTIAVADELAATAELATGKILNVPAVIIRGFTYVEAQSQMKSLIRHHSEDLFR